MESVLNTFIYCWSKNVCNSSAEIPEFTAVFAMDKVLFSEEGKTVE